MPENQSAEWFPLFEFQDWSYESTLIVPTAGELQAPAGSPVTARNWAKGELLLGQALKDGSSYHATGRLVFAPEVELEVSIRGTLGTREGPASFNAMGEGPTGRTKGTLYELIGWVFPLPPIANGAARPSSIRGSVMAVRGPDASPADAGGVPIGTVGAFVVRMKD